MELTASTQSSAFNYWPAGIIFAFMKKVGILGGGQLGRMLLQASTNYPVVTFVMEKDNRCPSAHLCHHFIKGNIQSFEDVYAFGQHLDAITIEIENVNIEALEKLESEGKTIIPRPSALRTIKNKISQKEFYRQHQIPTSPFVVTNNQSELETQRDFLPAVHKLASGGFDGRGVQVIDNEAELHLGFNEPAVLEKKVALIKEIALMVAVGVDGQTAIYPAVDMLFDPQLNLLSHQLCPAELPQEQMWKVEAIALSVVRNLKSPGIFAVELFVDKEGQVLVNETAPRVHNSGHHTIEGNYSSQFDMLWRIILQYPLGNTQIILPSGLLNVIGANNHEGPAIYEGLQEVLSIENAFVHIYGKENTSPGRKMGHVTVISNSKQDLSYKINKIKHLLKVVSKK